WGVDPETFSGGGRARVSARGKPALPGPAAGGGARHPGRHSRAAAPDAAGEWRWPKWTAWTQWTSWPRPGRSGRVNPPRTPTPARSICIGRPSAGPRLAPPSSALRPPRSVLRPPSSVLRLPSSVLRAFLRSNPRASADAGRTVSVRAAGGGARAGDGVAGAGRTGGWRAAARGGDGARVRGTELRRAARARTSPGGHPCAALARRAGGRHGRLRSGVVSGGSTGPPPVGPRQWRGRRGAGRHGPAGARREPGPRCPRPARGAADRAPPHTADAVVPAPARGRGHGPGAAGAEPAGDRIQRTITPRTRPAALPVRTRPGTPRPAAPTAAGRRAPAADRRHRMRNTRWSILVQNSLSE